jgi:hypothetical protein
VRAVVRVAAATVVAMCFGAGAAGSALAASRVASPNGTPNSTCSSAAPCDLVTALTGAQSGDDISLSAGDYGSPATPIQGSIETSAANLTVHGPSSGPRPRIFLAAIPSVANGSAGLVFDGTSTTLRDIEVHNVSSGVGAQAIFVAGGSTIDHVVASTAGEAEAPPAAQSAAAIIADGPTVVTDTVAYATNNGGGSFTTPGAEGLFLEANGGSDVVRNSTIVSAAGSLGFALEASGTVGTTVATLQNTIVSGGGNGLVVAEETGATMTVNADHDRISGETTASGTYNAGATVTAAAPVFVNAAAGDYREAPNSTATIDQGGPEGPGDPATDLDGDLRTVGAAPDIGADELPGAPSATATGTAAVASDHVTVLGSVTAAGGASQTSLQYGTTTAYGQQTPAIAVGPTANQQSISFPISGLAPGTTYHARITIVNQAGTVNSNDLTFTTAASPAGGAGGSGGSPGGSGNGDNTKPPTIHQTGHQITATISGSTYAITLPLTISCPTGESCVATTTLTVPPKTKHRKPKHPTKPTLIGAARITLAGGHHVNPTLKLNHTGAKLLRHHHQLRTSFTLKAHAGASVTNSKSGSILIKIKPPAHKHH